ncbi:MAG: putative toxin-antitoxin system toxin component, PIN family, partial [Burkholderiaceae bacterium]
MTNRDRRPPRVVIDTNVLLDFWLFDDPVARPLRAAFDDGRVVALRDDACDAELADVLARPRFALDVRRRLTLLATWRAKAEPIAHVAAAPFACSDPGDQKFIDLAVGARADALVSKD